MNTYFENASKLIYPVVALRDGIIFPDTENALLFGRDKSVLAIKNSLSSDRKIILVMQKNAKFDDPGESDLYRVGVLAHVQKVLEGEKGEMSALIKGEQRVKILEFVQENPYLTAQIEAMVEVEEESEEVNALVKHINTELKKAVNLGKGIDVVFLMNIMGGASPKQSSELVAMILDIKPEERQELLEETDLLKRLKK